MHVLERQPYVPGSDIGKMVSQTMIYREMLEVDVPKAIAYWQYVESNYRNAGFEQYEIDELTWEADVIVKSMEEDLAEL